AIGKHAFDLVLLDLLMPKKDGFEVLKEVMNNPELKNLPIIVLSNLGGDEDIKKALALGAKDYFVKTQHPMSEIVEKAKKYESR
ncbi:MAG: response regulator, partial [Patescibacteria group bacterium]